MNNYYRIGFKVGKKFCEIVESFPKHCNLLGLFELCKGCDYIHYCDSRKEAEQGAAGRNAIWKEANLLLSSEELNEYRKEMARNAV